MRVLYALLLACLIAPTLQAAGSTRPAADATFEKEFGDNFFDAYWALFPDYGVSVGYYKYAARLHVPDEKWRNEVLAFIDKSRAKLLSIDPQRLNESHRADWAILDNEFASLRWRLTELREWQWDPSTYNVADPFAKILSTDFAPLDERLGVQLAHRQEVGRVPLLSVGRDGAHGPQQRGTDRRDERTCAHW